MLIRNEETLNLVFQATDEATEETILNSLFKVATMVGRNGHNLERLPIERVVEILNRHGCL